MRRCLLLVALLFCLAGVSHADVIWLQLGADGTEALNHAGTTLTTSNLASYTAEVRNAADDLIGLADLHGLDEAAPGHFVGIIDLGELNDPGPITLVFRLSSPNARAVIGTGSAEPDNFEPTIDPLAHGIVALALPWIVNDPPVVAPDSYTTSEDLPLVVAASGPLQNDTDDSALSALLITPPASGTMDLAADGSFTFIPAANANGVFTMTYAASDGDLSESETISITVTAVNDAPVAEDDSYTIAEGESLADQVAANDFDVDSPSLDYQLTTQPTGELTFLADGSFTFEPIPHANGSDSFVYQISDGARTDSGIVSISITPVNDPPVAIPDGFTINEDTVLLGSVAPDNEFDGDPLQYTALGAASFGSLTLLTDGSLTYTPDADANGTESVTYRVSDGVFADSTTLTIIVLPQADAPAPQADSYSMNEDQSLEIAAESGLLANDLDADDDPLSATLLADSAHATITIALDGAFSYEPAPDFHGIDQFTYTTSDGSTSVSAVVTIEVAPQPDPPVAAADSYTVFEDTVLVVPAPGPLENDTDGDHDPLSLVQLSNPAGMVTAAANGAFTYKPNENFFGADAFVYAATDGDLDSAPEAITILVISQNDFPVAGADFYQTPEDTALHVAAPGVLSNDSDLETAQLTASLVSSPQFGVASVQADGAFTYTPHENQFGQDQFTYAVDDGQDSVSAIITVTVHAENDPPTVSALVFSTQEDVPLVVDAGEGLLTTANDAENDALLIQLSSLAAGGSMTVAADGAFTYTPDANWFGSEVLALSVDDGVAQSATTTLTLLVASVNDRPVAEEDLYVLQGADPLVASALIGLLANDSDVDGDQLSIEILADVSVGTFELLAEGSFSYTPQIGFNGSDSLTYRVSDGALSATATVTFFVGGNNQLPVAQPDTYTLHEDTTLIVPAEGVLSNDSDPDHDPLTVVLGGLPQHGSLTLDASGAFTYRPTADFAGDDSFTYLAWDASLPSAFVTVSLAVQSVNDPPIAKADAYTMTEDVPLIRSLGGGLQANDSDVDSPTLTLRPLTTPATGVLELAAEGAFTYTPAENETSTQTFIYELDDGEATVTATVSIAITPVNDAPVAGDETFTLLEDIPLLAAVTIDDVEGGLSLRVLEHPEGNLDLSAEGSFTYWPVSHAFGNDAFVYRIDDNEHSLSATVTLQIEAVNDPPVLTALSFTTDEDTSLTAAIGFDDVEGGVTFTAQTQPTGLLSFVSDGSFSYEPPAQFHGQDTFVVSLQDGAIADSATVTIVVISVPDRPIAQPDHYEFSGRDAVLFDNSVLANDTDDDLDAQLTAQLATQPTGGSLTLAADGTFTYTPGGDFTGIDSFSYQAYDGLLLSDPATVTVQTQFEEHAVSLSAGWQIISVPGAPLQPVGTMFGNCPVAQVHEVDETGATVQLAEHGFLEPGRGYWALAKRACQPTLYLLPGSSTSVELGALEWALIGPLQAAPWPGEEPLIIWDYQNGWRPVAPTSPLTLYKGYYLIQANAGSVELTPPE